MEKVKKSCYVLSVKYIPKSEKEKIDSYFFHRRWIGTANIRHFAELLKLKKMSSKQLYAFYPEVFIDNENYQSEKKWVVWPYHKKRAQFFLKYEIMATEIEILENNNKILLKKLSARQRNFYNKNGDFNWLIDV